MNNRMDLLSLLVRNLWYVFVVLLLLTTATTSEAAEEELDLDTSRPAANLHSVHQYALLPDGVFIDTVDIKSTESADVEGIALVGGMDMYMEMEISVSNGDDAETTVIDIELSDLSVKIDAGGMSFEYDSTQPELSTLGEDQAMLFNFMANSTQHIVMDDEDGTILDYSFSVDGETYGEDDDVPLDDTFADSALGVDITSKLWNILPDKDIAPGDSWDTSEVDMGDYFLGPLTGKTTLQGYFSFESQHDVAVLRTEGTLLVNESSLMDLFNKSMLGASLGMGGDVSVLDDEILCNATFYVDPAAKLIRYSQVSQTYTLVIDLGEEMDEMVGGAMNMPTSETITSTSSLKEDVDDQTDGSGSEPDPNGTDVGDSDNIDESSTTNEDEALRPPSEHEDGETSEEEPAGGGKEEVEPPMIGGEDSTFMEQPNDGNASTENSSPNKKGGGPSATVILLFLAGIVFVFGAIVLRRRRNSKSEHTMIPQDLNLELT